VPSEAKDFANLSRANSPVILSQARCFVILSEAKDLVEGPEGSA
jgi:hypothetical protein